MPRPAPTPRWHTLAVLLLIAVGVAAMAAIFTYVTLMERQERRQLALADELRLLSLRTMADALLASEGDEHAFPRVEQALTRGQRLLLRLHEGDPERGLAPLPPPARPALEAAQQAWGEFQETARGIVEARPVILTVREYVRALNDLQPELAALQDAVARVLLDAQAPPLAIYHATHQALLSQRIATEANRLLAEGTAIDQAIAQMRQDLDTFTHSLDALRHGSTEPGMPPRVGDPRARLQLDALAALLDTIGELVLRITEQGPALGQLRHTRERLEAAAERLNARLATLTAAIEALPQQRPVNHLTAYLLGALVAGLFLLLGLLLVRDVRRRYQEESQRHQRQRQAIQRLGEEIRPLGRGDLTIHAHPRDPMLEPVAEAINYAVAALRELVAAIDRTAQGVATTAEETQATALHLRRASQHQSEQIAAVGRDIAQLAKDSDDVHREASEAVDAARDALHSAEQGAAAIRECQAELRALDGQLGETAKRIRHLGESAQEVGDIVQLIADLAEQTHILALNAAIRASGDHQHDDELAAIADEVQQLAERSNQAAARIEHLIDTIRHASGDTVAAVERSRDRLSTSVRRAEWAGNALLDIQQTVARLSHWVEAVASIAEEQAASARRSAKTMEWIQGVALRNLAGSEQTAELAYELGKQAQALRQAVEGFRRDPGATAKDD